MSKLSLSPNELSKQFSLMSPPSPLLRDDTNDNTGFPLTPPVFSDLSSAPSTLSKDSMGNIVGAKIPVDSTPTSVSASTSKSKKGLTPLNLSGFSSVSSAPSGSTNTSERSYLSSPKSYTSKVSRGSNRPLTSLPTSPDISFSPLLPSPSPTPSQQKVKKTSVLVPVSLSSSASSASSASCATWTS